MDGMNDRAEGVAAFMKAMASPHRLLILCQLAEGERNVSSLIEATGLAPTSMSQHLKKLKDEGLIDFRREHRELFYFISHEAASEVMSVLYKHFCDPKNEGKKK